MSLRVLLTLFVFGLSVIKTVAMPVDHHRSAKRTAAGRLQQIEIESDGSMSNADEPEQDEAVEDVELIEPDHESNEPKRSSATVRSQVHQTSGFSITGRRTNIDSPVVRAAKPQKKVEPVLRAEVDASSVDIQTTTKRRAGGGRFAKNDVVEEGDEDSVPVVKTVKLPVAQKNVTVKAHSLSSIAKVAPAPAPLIAFADDADDDADEPSAATPLKLQPASVALDQAKPRIVQTMTSMSGGAFYLVPFCFGQHEEKQCLMGIPDTGSFEIVVRSTLCQEVGCSGPMYNKEKHSTYSVDLSKEKENNTVILTYGSGPVVTEPGFERVCIGNSSICSTKQHVLLTKTTTIEALIDGDITGIFGIGRGDEKGFKDRFITRLGVDRYSVCLATKETEDGQFIVNDDDVSNNQSFTKIDIFGVEHWAAKLTNMKLHLKDGTNLGDNSQQDLPLDCENGCGAILDSGTTFITPPKKTLQMLAKYMKHNNFSCEDWESLPDLQFNFGNNTYTLPPNAYIALVDVAEIPGWLRHRLHFKPQEHHACMFLFIDPIETQTQQGPAMIMGMPFFRYYYTQFDYKNKQVFAAPHNKCKVGPEAISSWQAPPMRMNFNKLLPRDQKLALGSIV